MSSEKVMDLQALVDQRGALAARWLSDAIADRDILRKQLADKLTSATQVSTLQVVGTMRMQMIEWEQAVLTVLEELAEEAEDDAES